MTNVLEKVFEASLQQDAEVELLARAAIRCGYTCPHLEYPAYIVPTRERPARLLDGTETELGRWWSDFDREAAEVRFYVVATNPEVCAMMAVIRPVKVDA